MRDPRNHGNAPKRATEQDRAIGARIAALRVARGLSQTVVANRIGVSFQQVQKYEKGANRIGAGRLRSIADLLGVPVSALFEEDPDLVANGSVVSLLRVEGAGSLVRTYAAIDDPGLRRDVLSLVRSAARLSAGS